MGVSRPDDWDLREEVGEGWGGLRGDRDVRGRWGRVRRGRERGGSLSPMACLHTDESSDEFATDSVGNERTLSIVGSSSVKLTTQDYKGF